MADAVIGRGYLQVVPKMDSDALDSELSKAGKSGSSTFATSFSSGMTARAVAIGNILSETLMKGIEKASEFAGKMISDAFTSYAEFEQLAGGVEKIFDEMDNSRVFADAGNAWRDLNMSANEYMATINDVGAMFSATMSDEAAYDAARRGMLAISDYASGTGKDLDLLNQKFAMITRSTSSYQSIADQFAGILPATSKDFLEQAKAAGYLSEEYEKLTEVPIDEYQEALVDMLEKGTKDLNLYGNTAAETAKTISGSVAGMKAAWSNWLTGIADETADMDKLTDDLVEAVGNVVDNALPRVQAILSRIGPAATDAISFVLHDISPELGDFFDSVAEAAGKLAEGFGRIVEQAEASGVLKGVATAIYNIGDAISSADFGPFFDMLGGALEKFNEFHDFMADWNSEVIMENGGMVMELTDPSTWHMFSEESKTFQRDLEALGASVYDYGRLSDKTMEIVANAYRDNGHDMEAALASAGLAVDELTGKIVSANEVELRDQEATVRVDTSEIDSAKRDWTNWTPEEKTAYVTTTIKGMFGNAMGGFAKLHAAGDFITNGPTWLGRDANGIGHIAGEDGREWVKRHADGTTSIVPIENRKYLEPYANTIASMIGGGSGDTYILNVDGARVNDDAEIQAAMLALFNTMRRKGVMLRG